MLRLLQRPCQRSLRRPLHAPLRAPLGSRRTPAAARALLLAVLMIGAGAPGLVGCSSTGDGDEGPKLSNEQKMGIYLENSLRYLELGEIQRAEDQARRGLEIDPDNARFLLIFGSCKLLQGDAQSIQAAIDTFETIPKKDQADFRVQMRWAAAIERKGVLYEEASMGVRDGTRPTDAPDRGRRADELMEEAHGYWREAKRRFQRSLEISSGQPEALGGLVRTTGLLGETDESIEYARQLIEAIRSSQRLVTLQLEDDAIEANAESKLFSDQRTNRQFEVKTRLHIAFLLRDQGKLAESVQEFDEIILIEPDLAEAHSLKAQLLFDLGEYVKARTSIERFIEIKARTSEFEDPSIKRAYDLHERCERAIGIDTRG